MQRGVMFQYFEWYLPDNGNLWNELVEQAQELKPLGVTAVWTPPAYKGCAGTKDVGYGVYDLFDLGEFNQKGTTRTKYGTREQFIAAVKALHAAGIHVYADAVFNHRVGTDELEEMQVDEINDHDRNQVVAANQKVMAPTRFVYSGRNGKYSKLQLRSHHFSAFAHEEGGRRRIYRFKGKSFSVEVSGECGNYDFLLGADVDMYHPEIREDLILWGKWMVETTGVDGFRLDAVKHTASSFTRDWLQHLRENFPDRELFTVCEYWSSHRDDLKRFLHDTEGVMHLFDVPLHHKFNEASEKGREFDLREIFDGTLVQSDPALAVTFVENHDTRPGQSLQSCVNDWFKPQAYALILLRKDGYPCLFHGDFFGVDDHDHPMTSHQKIIRMLCDVRQKFMHGEQTDYFTNPNCIGWIWSGDEQHPASMAVVLSNADEGGKIKMKAFGKSQTYRDITGNCPDTITTDDNGEAEFGCMGGKLSVWCVV